jgi:hypothetical protein
MNIRKFFCMLIAGLAIIGFTTVGMASEEGTHGESTEATKSEATAEGEDTAKADSDAEIKEEADEKEAKADGKE